MENAPRGGSRKVSEKKAPLGMASLHPAALGVHIHQNNVRADSADAPPGDQIVLLPAPKPPKAAGHRYPDGGNTSVGQLNLHIGNKPHPLPVRKANHFFAPKIRKLNGISLPVIWYSLRAAAGKYATERGKISAWCGWHLFPVWIPVPERCPEPRPPPSGCGCRKTAGKGFPFPVGTDF